MERDVSPLVFIYCVGRSYVLLDYQGKKMNAGCQLEFGRLCHNTDLSTRHILLFCFQPVAQELVLRGG